MKRKLLFLTLIAVLLTWGNSLYGQTVTANKPQADGMQKRVTPQAVKVLNIPPANTKSQKRMKSEAAVGVADLSKFAGRTIYGNLVFIDAWSELASYDVPYGFYSYTIDDSKNPDFKALLTSNSFDSMAGTYAKGKFYTIRPISLFGALTGVSYNVFNTNPWGLENRNIIDSPTYDYLASSMVYDATSNKIYALQYNEDLSGLYWSTFDKENSTFEVVAKWRGKFDALALIATPDGKMYCIATDGDFYSIDKETGNPSLIGSTGVSPTLYSQSAIYDGKTGTILWSSMTAAGSELYTVNIATGKASFIRNFPAGNQIVGLYLLDNEAVDGAAAIVGDLKVTYSQEGGLNANISFTVPTTTYAGQALSGNVNITLWVDGVAVKSESAAAGTKYNVPYQFTNDNHYLAISVANAAGLSPYYNTDFFVGYDTPQAVQNLSFSIKDGASTVTWNAAPTKGVNDGYIDQNALFYKVYRFPGNVLVADNLKETTFGETLPTEMQNYYYTVIPYNGANKIGVSASSNILNYGSAFPVPYVQMFDGESSLSLFTIFDNNKDGQTWRYTSNKEVDINTSTAGSDHSDDWLITPRIRFEASKKYRLVFAARGYAQNYVENLKIYLGTDPKDISSFNTELHDFPNMAVYSFTDQTVEFTVPADGDYSLGFYAYSEKSKSSLIRLNKIVVDAIGNVGAPDEVSNLKVIRDANDLMAATVSFTTPTKSLNNEALTELTKVYVYRGESSDLVHTFESPAIGADLSWKDESVAKVGVTTYRVVAENAHGVGKYSETADFIGVYSSPYIETFETSKARELYTTEKTISGTSNDWTYDATNKRLNLNNFCMTTGDFRLYTPAIKLEAESVYQLSFKYMNSGSGKMTHHATVGLNPTADSQTEVGLIPSSYSYIMRSTEFEFSTTAEGKYYMGIDVKANAIYDYISSSIDSISVKKIASAKSPGKVENLSVKPGDKGVISSVFSFNAPTIDYAGRTLSSISKIDIFRGNNSIPIKSFANPSPGDALAWVDEELLKGNNMYLIVASNEFGLGRAVQDTVYVGKDIPSAVSDLKIKTDATNQIPTLTWVAPKVGINGGYVDVENLSYTIVEYHPVSEELTIIASSVKDLTYTINSAAKPVQDVYYYGVVPITNEGQGKLLLSYTTLGSLFSLPFTESFPNSNVSTEPWVTDSQYPTYAYWTPTVSLNNGIDPQDNDGGMAVYYSIAYNTMIEGSLTSPKIALNGKSTVLTFWIYQGLAPVYPTTPYFSVDVSVNSEEFASALNLVYTNEEVAGWKKYRIDLAKYKDANYLQFRIKAATAGYPDMIYMDNVSLIDVNDESGIGSGIYDGISVQGVTDGIIVKGAERKIVNVYNASGQIVSSFVASDEDFKSLPKGFYLVKIETHASKVMVK